MSSIDQLAQEWLRLDQDPDTRREIEHLRQAGATQELEKRLRNRLTFGTAGLRARMEAGFARLNALTIIQASQGLAAYLLAQDASTSTRGVVVGHDARHNSEKFAKLTAAALVAKNIKVWYYDGLVHTPLVPFGVDALGAVAGVMVTASHNPSYDNGYKVYWSNGCQIIPPHDKGIANAILQNLEPVSWDASVVDGHEPLVQIVPDSVKDRYFEAVCAAAKIPGAGPPQGRPFVYTPMHGVGLPYMQEAVRRLGMERDMVVVKKQAEPDPDFPTVKFPNPEEHGALDLAIQTADRNGIDLVIASDPDADRLAVATKSDGTWHQLSGNQLGVLFASHILSTISKPSERAKTALICTAVSTGMLQAICAAEGVHFEETLTGFKWMGNKALELERSGYNVPFAFEEAIGYMFSRVVHDKDAIAAAAVFLTAAATWRTQHASRGPWEEYQRLAQKYGSFENANTYLISPDAGTTNRVFEDIRGLADPFPATLGARRILRWRDLTRGWDSATDDHVPVLPASGDSQMITCELEGKVKFTVRGSGTEPKIKFYIECQADSAEEAQKGANQVLDDLLKEWFKPEVYGLKLAS